MADDKRLNDIIVDHEMITNDIDNKIEEAESPHTQEVIKPQPLPDTPSGENADTSTAEMPESIQPSEDLIFQVDTDNFKGPYAGDPNIRDALYRHANEDDTPDKVPQQELPAPQAPPEAPDTIDPEAGDPLVSYLDLDDAKPWAGGERDQAPDEYRAMQDVVESAYQYHSTLAELLTEMQKMLLNGISELETISARFQRMR